MYSNLDTSPFECTFYAPTSTFFFPQILTIFLFVSQSSKIKFKTLKRCHKIYWKILEICRVGQITRWQISFMTIFSPFLPNNVVCIIIGVRSQNLNVVYFYHVNLTRILMLFFCFAPYLPLPHLQTIHWI